MHPRSFRSAAMALAVACAWTRADAQAAPAYPAEQAQAGPAQSPPQSPLTTVWQVVPAATFMNGSYAPATTAGEIRRHGSIGVGTPGAANGELTMINSTVYHTFANAGTVVGPPDSAGVSFAIVTGWDERDSRRVNVGPDLTYPGTFTAAVDAQLPTLNAFYALHMTGRWRQVVVRNLIRQSSPYVPFPCSPIRLDTLSASDAEGTMVGFREPPFADGMSVSGFHLHFINKAGRGGHVIGFLLGAEPGAVTLNVSERREFTLRMPPAPAPPPAGACPYPATVQH